MEESPAAFPLGDDQTDRIVVIFDMDPRGFSSP